MVINKEKYQNAHIYRLAYNDNKHYIFDYETLVFAELDELFNSCFDFIENKITWDELLNKYGEDVYEAIKSIDELIESGEFYSEEKHTISLPLKYVTGLISLPPIHNCNLKCSYCFAEQGNVFHGTERKFTKEMVETALRYIYYKYMPDCEKYRIDFVSGGEPLLNFEIIKQVKEISDILYKETNKPMEIWVCTNGTCFTPEILEFFNTNHINIGISIDGDQELHDSMRIDASGRGTYESIIKSIEMIKASKSYSKSLKDIWGLVVITSCTKSLVNILQHHKKIGLKNVQMKIARLTKDSPYSINQNNIQEIKNIYTELFEFFSSELENDSVDYIKMILNDNDFAGKIVRRLLMRYRVINRCQAGKNKVSIAANGDMYPCDSFVGMPQFLLGNVITGTNDNQLFKDINVETNTFCEKCWARYVCGGDCYHNSYLTNCSIKKPDGIICELEKHIIILSLIYLDKMASEYLHLYEYLQNILNKKELLK